MNTQKTANLHNGCNFSEIKKLLSKKWAFLILETLEERKQIRFNTLRKSLQGITSRTLALQLQELAKQECIAKVPSTPLQDSGLATTPALSAYTLTQKGKNFLNFFQGVKFWGVETGFLPPSCKEMSCRKCFGFEEKSSLYTLRLPCRLNF